MIKAVGEWQGRSKPKERGRYFTSPLYF